VVLRTKDKVFKASSINTALESLQRRHPFLHSVFMSLPFVGPYFALSGAPLIVRDIASREILDDDSAEKTFQLQEQGVIDNELNAKFYSPYTDFLENLLIARTRHAMETAMEKAGELEPGTAISEDQVRQQVPELPLLRVTLVNGSSGLGQSLIITLPQVIADGASASNLAKELLEQVEKVEACEAKGEVVPEPLYLQCLNNMDEFYPRRVGGIGAAFTNLQSWIHWLRYCFKLKVDQLEKFHAWIPNESRVIRSASAEIPLDIVNKIKQAAHAHNTHMGHLLSATSVAATHEIFFPTSDNATLPTQVWVDLRPHFDAPIAEKHLGLLAGRIQGHVKSNVGDSIWDLARQVQEFDEQIPDEAFRSIRWLANTWETDRKIIASRSPSEKPIGAPLQLAPVNIANMGALKMPSSLMERFGVTSAATFFGQSENTRFTTFTSLPNGNMTITVTYPDLIFTRSDISDYIDSLVHHLKLTAEGQ